jgi:hypothetical protein
MFFWWGSGWGWLAGLISAGLWILIIVGAIVLLRRELPDLQHRFSTPPALRVLEDRYAKGEITREEFLHRREVLMSAHGPPPPSLSDQAPSPPPARGPSATPPQAAQPPPAQPTQAPPVPEATAETPTGSDQAEGAMSSTYEPPRPATSGPPGSGSGAGPAQPLPPAEHPE